MKRKIKNKIKKVFLGGTVNKSAWRDKLIPLLKINYFNPVVKEWTPKSQTEEIRQREKCDYCLYVITPKMTGVYSIAEVVSDSYEQPEKTIFCVLPEDEGDTFDEAQIRSLIAVEQMIRKNKAKVFNSLEEIADYLNG